MANINEYEGTCTECGCLRTCNADGQCHNCQELNKDFRWALSQLTARSLASAIGVQLGLLPERQNY